MDITIYFIYLKFSKHVYNSEQKTVQINKHAAWHYRALNLIKSRWLQATGYRHLNINKLKIKVWLKNNTIGY